MIPPCADEVMIGTGWPVGDRGLVCATAAVLLPTAAARRARGMYGV